MLKLATKMAPRREALETAYRAGFRHAELWLDAALLANWRPLADLVSDYPLSYALHFPNQLDLGREALEHAALLYRRLGCQALVIHQPMLDKYGAALAQLDPGVRPAVENHRLTVAEFDQWATRNPGLALDVEHLWMYTLHDAPLDELLGQVRGFLARFRDKLRHVHLPGYWPAFKEHRPMYCAREMIFPVLSLLAEARFDGLIVSEVDVEYQNLEELRMDLLLFDVWRTATCS